MMVVPVGHSSTAHNSPKVGASQVPRGTRTDEMWSTHSETLLSQRRRGTDTPTVWTNLEDAMCVK